MAGIPQAQPHAGEELALGVVVERLELAHGLVRVRARVQRLDQALALAQASPVFVFGVLLVQRGGVLEHDLAQVARRPVGVNRPAKTGLHQQRQPAGVIQMGMGQDHGVEVAGD